MPWVWSPAQKQGNKHASKQATKTTHRCLLPVRPLRANFIIRVLTSPMGYSTDQLVDQWTIRRWDIVGRNRSLVTLLWRQYLDPSPFPVRFSTSGYQGRLGYALLPHHGTMYPVKSALEPLRCWVRIHIFSFKISLSSPGWPWTLTPPALVSLKYSSHLALCSCLLFCTAMGSWKTQNQPLWWFLSNRVASSLLNTWNIANLSWDVL